MLKQLADEFQMEAYAGAEYEYFQFKETPQSASDKQYNALQALTPGNHGYSLLRPLLNNDYFHGIYDNVGQLMAALAVHLHYVNSFFPMYCSASNSASR